MTTATATYESDDVMVAFGCRMERSDYGVTGSPTWFEPISDSIEINELEILGVTVDPMNLPMNLVQAIMGLADGLDWEGDD